MPRRVRPRTRGFTLLELLLALVIVATALVSLGAVVSSGIGSAADSINERAAREACRTKLEECVAAGETSGGGQVEGHESFTWNMTREEHTAGAIDSPDEKFDIVTVTVTFPQDNTPTPTPGMQGMQAGTGTIRLATIVDPPDLPPPGSAPLPGQTPPAAGGMMPGGTMPGGTMPGGTMPGGMMPGGTMPGGMMPGGMMPGGTMPGGMLPGGRMPPR